MINTERTLTVSSLYREWGAPYRKGHSVVPSIRLSGNWLSALGIMPGQKIRVVANGAMLYSTYRELVLPAESERYWQIAPAAEAENVVAFTAVR
jgi:hypothetical protein